MHDVRLQLLNISKNLEAYRHFQTSRMGAKIGLCPQPEPVVPYSAEQAISELIGCVSAIAAEVWPEPTRVAPWTEKPKDTPDETA